MKREGSEGSDDAERACEGLPFLLPLLLPLLLPFLLPLLPPEVELNNTYRKGYFPLHSALARARAPHTFLKISFTSFTF